MRVTRLVVGVAAAAALAGPAALATVPVSAAIPRSPGGAETAGVTAVSCQAARHCTAVGYLNPPGLNEVFAVSQSGGTWRPLVKISLSALPGGATRGQMKTVSCASPGNCTAGGTYLDHAEDWRAFVVTEKNGAWGKPLEISVAGLHIQGPIDSAEIDFVACERPGACDAIGDYQSYAQEELFGITERDGNWGKAAELPGITKISPAYGATGIDTFSCSSAGNCAIGGSSPAAQKHAQAFVAAETNGTWHKAVEVPGTAAANKGGLAGTQAVSCPSPGYCVAVGSYTDSAQRLQAFASTDEHGTWGGIKTVPGLAALPGNTGTTASLDFVWCASAGNCTAVGAYDSNKHYFDVTEKNGTWGRARKIRLGARAYVTILAVACTSIGNCSAGGFIPGRGSHEAFVITETNGIWGPAKEVPGSVALNHGGDATVSAISCSAPGDCAAGGYYSSVFPYFDPYVVTQKNGTWGRAEKIPGLP